MHNYDDKYPARPGFEPGTSRLQAPVDTNEPSGPARNNNVRTLCPANTTRWPNVYDVGPTLSQHWVNVSCLLGV